MSLLFNEDCTNIFFGPRFPAGKAGETIDRYVDVVAGAGVTEFFCNTNARLTNYRSGVWEAFWDGYDPQGADDQPFLASIPKESVGDWRRLLDNMLATHDEGVDYPARVIDRCRHHGLVPWISLRMNDVHCTDDPQHPIHGMFWKTHPELRRQGATGWFHSAYDYAHKKVRDRYCALIVETLERYDADGLELDFMREPYLFSVGREAEGGRILTAWIREIRGWVDAASSRRGHAIKLGVRVPSRVETSLGLGLDVISWAKEGLVDLVVPTNRWATIEFDMPLAGWRKCLGAFKGTLAGGIDVSVSSYPGAPMRNALEEISLARGAAMSVLSGGADALYLFNYFPVHCFPKLNDVAGYQDHLRSLSSMERLQKAPRTHVVTWREVQAPGEIYRAPLPATGRSFSFPLPLGPRPGAGRAVSVILLSEAASLIPDVRLNGASCPLHNEACGKEGRRVLVYTAPEGAVGGENSDQVEVLSAEADLKLLGLGVSIS